MVQPNRPWTLPPTLMVSRFSLTLVAPGFTSLLNRVEGVVELMNCPPKMSTGCTGIDGHDSVRVVTDTLTNNGISKDDDLEQQGPFARAKLVLRGNPPRQRSCLVDCLHGCR